MARLCWGIVTVIQARVSCIPSHRTPIASLRTDTTCILFAPVTVALACRHRGCFDLVPAWELTCGGVRGVTTRPVPPCWGLSHQPASKRALDEPPAQRLTPILFSAPEGSSDGGPGGAQGDHRSKLFVFMDI